MKLIGFGHKWYWLCLQRRFFLDRDDDMKNYVISLVGATDRRNHIAQQFDAHQIDFEFFDAISKDQAIEKALQLGISVARSDLTLGEVACLMSHVCIWQKIVDEKIPYVAIFEDDIHLSHGASDYLGSSDWLSSKISILKIEKFFGEVVASPFSMRLNKDGRKVFKLLGTHLGCAGYVLSVSGAEDLLHYIRSYDAVKAVDHIVFEDYIKNGALDVYQMNPSLCIQDNMLFPEKNKLVSSLEGDRGLRMSKKDVNEKKNVLNFYGKIKRELLMLIIRPFLKLRDRVFKEKVTW